MNNSKLFGSLIAVLLITSSPLHAADDTFTCLQQSGPKITISKNFGYTSYRNRSFADNTTFDARRSRWQQEQVPDYKNPSAINIGGGKNGCWAGGTVIGTSDLNASWKQLYQKIDPDDPNSARQNSASIVSISAANLTIDGIRIYNAWDSIKPADNSPNFTVKNVWVSRSRDDCIENDNGNPGLITDSMIDGCYMFYSKTGRGSGTVTVQNSLARLQPMPGAHCESGCLQPGTKTWFKGNVIVKLYNNIFMQQQKANVSTRVGGMPKLKTDGTPEDKILDCSNNIMVWTGPGEYPYYLDPRCFTVTKDRSVWDRARQNWINCHPNVSRKSNDPVSDPSKCDPNAPGGGEGGTGMAAANAPG